MRVVFFAAALLVTIPARAEDMSPNACNALSNAASNAAENMDGVIKQLSGTAFRQAMPVMPQRAKAPAADVEDARISAQMALQEYQHALQDFSRAINNCGM